VRTSVGAIAELNPRPDRTGISPDTVVSFVPMKAVEVLSGRMDPSETRLAADVMKGFTSFQEGDVLAAKITPCMEIGKVAIARGLKNGIGFGSTEFHVIRALADISREYVLFYLLQERIRREARLNMTGAVGQLRVPAAFLDALDLPLPPAPEQRRIVAMIEELFSKLDAGVEELEKAKAQLKRYRQSVLKAAFSGELTGDWRKKRLATSKEPPETAQELLERIREERKRLATSEGRKWKEPPTLDTSELPELPEGWAWARMDAVNHRIQDGTHFSPTEQFDSPGDDRYPYVTSKNIRDWGMELDDITYVSEGTHRPIYDRCNPELGDVLLVKDGVNTGTVTTNTLDGEFSLLSSVALLKPIRHGLNPDYLRYYLASPIGQRMIAGRMSGVSPV